MDEQVIKPDLSFVKDVIASGGEDLKKCYQCSTCTVVCGVTPDDKPFPRKEMLYAQWGLKDKLLGSPDIWLCHQCSDCTAHCPRGAKPGEVLGAVRNVAIKHYATPAALGQMVGNSKSLLLLFAVPILIFGAIIASLGHFNFSAVPPSEHGGLSYSNFIPVLYVDAVFVPIALFAVLAFFAGVKKYWGDLCAVNGTGKGDVAASLTETIKDILSHKKFELCNVTKERKTAHLLVFYAFIGLAITTGIGVLYLYGLKRESPYPLYDPMKIIGNVSALALLIGITMVINNRMKNKEKAGGGSYFDWLFIIVIFGIMATGILSEVLRLANIAALAFPMYYAHLVFVFFLFAYAPFSKMAHMVYRTTAMVYARHAQREKS